MTTEELLREEFEQRVVAARRAYRWEFDPPVPPHQVTGVPLTEADANVIGAAIQQIERRVLGQTTAHFTVAQVNKKILTAASESSSPLHSYFDWQGTSASRRRYLDRIFESLASFTHVTLGRGEPVVSIQEGRVNVLVPFHIGD